MIVIYHSTTACDARVTLLLAMSIQNCVSLTIDDSCRDDDAHNSERGREETMSFCKP